ncbi:MAG: AsmA-like C-terminal region-containing protein [Flavobacteriales bacterium]
MQRVLTWFLILIILGVAFVTGAYFLAKKYEEPVRNYIISEVNKRLNAPVHVSDINFSLLERFPSASLVMDSVWAEESLVKIGKADTLLFFRKMYLNLNIFDILDGSYKINEIEARDGFIHLLVDEKGYDNFHIWKTSEDTTGFLLELSRVHIENGWLSYINKARQQNIQLKANELWFNGRFSDDSYTMAVKGDGEVYTLSIKGTEYLKNRFVDVESELDIITESETYAFRKGALEIDNDLSFDISGKFEGEGIDLKIAGQDLDIIRSLSLIPAESIQWLDEYSSSGVVDFECTLKGAFGKTNNPELIMKFQLEDGAISKRGSNWKLSNLSGSGVLENGSKRNAQTTLLHLDRLKGALNGDTFSTVLSVLNFEQPTIESHLRLSTSIEGLDDFFNIELIEKGSGRVEVDATIKTTLLNPTDAGARDFLNSRASGVVRLANTELKLMNDDRLYRVDSSEFQIQNNALIIHSYHGKINDCTVDLTGKAENFLDYFFTENGHLNVNGKIVVGDLDLEALFPSRGDESKAGSVVIAFPEKASWNLEIIAKSFINGKFRADEVSGLLVMNKFKVEANSLHFLSQDGNVTGKAGLYRFADNQFGLKTEFRALNIDVKTLFHTFNEFDQKFVTSEHLSGRADAEVQLQALCDSVLSINTETIIATADVLVRNGALIGLDPLISIADEIRKKPMLRLFVSTEELKKRLENVQFAELRNQISIRNSVVTIPQMEIKSSALDLNISGTHTFNNHIDYAMDFALSELLELKDRKEPYNEYVQRDKSGKTRMYLTIKGTTDDFKVELQKTNVRSTLKDNMTLEKNAVKGLLKQEFRIFSGDSNAVYEEPESEELEFEFDPEAGTSVDVSKPAKSDSIKAPVKDKNVLNRIIKKTESDKKKLREGDFDDDDF